MKTTIIILFLIASQLCFSQDDNRDLQYQTEFIFELQANNGTISISKYDSQTLTETSLVFTTEIRIMNNAKGLTLYLSSGEVLSFKNSINTCEPLDNGNFKLSSSIILSPDLYKKLSQTDLLSFQIGLIKVQAKFKEEGENFKELFSVAEREW